MYIPKHVINANTVLFNVSRNIFLDVSIAPLLKSLQKAII